MSTKFGVLIYLSVSMILLIAGCSSLSKQQVLELHEWATQLSQLRDKTDRYVIKIKEKVPHNSKDFEMAKNLYSEVKNSTDKFIDQAIRDLTNGGTFSEKHKQNFDSATDKIREFFNETDPLIYNRFDPVLLIPALNFVLENFLKYMDLAQKQDSLQRKEFIEKLTESRWKKFNEIN